MNKLIKMEEQLLLEEINNLFAELKEEENGRYAPGSYSKILDPSSENYYYLAEELIEKSKELSENSEDSDNFYLECLYSVLSKEVETVRLFTADYKKNSNRMTNQSKKQLQSLMRKATEKIKMYCPYINIK